MTISQTVNVGFKLKRSVLSYYRPNSFYFPSHTRNNSHYQRFILGIDLLRYSILGSNWSAWQVNVPFDVFKRFFKTSGHTGAKIINFYCVGYTSRRKRHRNSFWGSNWNAWSVYVPFDILTKFTWLHRIYQTRNIYCLKFGWLMLWAYWIHDLKEE